MIPLIFYENHGFPCIFCCYFLFLFAIGNICIPGRSFLMSVIVLFSFFAQHLFACEQKESLVKCLMESAAAFVGIAVKQRKEPITFESFITHRLGKYRLEEHSI